MCADRMRKLAWTNKGETTSQRVRWRATFATRHFERLDGIEQTSLLRMTRTPIVCLNAQSNLVCLLEHTRQMRNRASVKKRGHILLSLTFRRHQESASAQPSA